MTSIFKVKVRKVGSSLGILIPKDLADDESIKEGEEIEVTLFKQRKLENVLKLLGTAKGSKPFERDRKDRIGA